MGFYCADRAKFFGDFPKSKVRFFALSEKVLILHFQKKAHIVRNSRFGAFGCKTTRQMRKRRAMGFYCADRAKFFGDFPKSKIRFFSLSEKVLILHFLKKRNRRFKMRIRLGSF